MKKKGLFVTDKGFFFIKKVFKMKKEGLSVALFAHLEGE